MDNPKLLVMITTYQRGYNLPAVVDSVVSQTFKNYKIVICDDCSPENPAKIIKDIKKKYPRVDIEHHRNRVNIGEFPNVIATIGREFDNDFKYVVVLQDDTIYLDNSYLENGIKILEKNSNLMYCGGIVTKNGVPEPLFNIEDDQIGFVISGLDLWREWGKFQIHWTSCIFRYMDVLEHYFRGHRRDAYNGDNFLLLRIAMNGDIIIYNQNVLELAYNKNGMGYLNAFKDPVERFIKLQQYYKLASKVAVEHGVSKEEADSWFIFHQTKLALNAIRLINGDKELLTKFTNLLMDYDKKLSVAITSCILNS